MTANTAPDMICFANLHLNDARALLAHDGCDNLPDPQTTPTEHVQVLIDNLCELSLRDPLTGLPNRRHFRNVLNREIEAMARSRESTLLLMLDIDHFKKVNDAYGHVVGDRVLQAVSQSLMKCVRPMDTVARYGGEEFAVILPNCAASFGATVAERIREVVGALRVAVTAQIDIQVSISIGGAYAPDWLRSTDSLWIERADTQLYRAKAEGRNRVYIDEQREITVSAEEKSMLFGHLLIGDPAWIEPNAGNTTNKVK